MKDSLVIILFDHPWEHTSDYASQTADYFSKDNTVIGLLLKDARSIKEAVFTNKTDWFWKKAGANYYVCKPLYIIPFRRFKFVERMNIIIYAAVTRLMIAVMALRRNLKKTYIWIFNPENLLPLRLFGSSVISVYDCVDYHGHEPAQNSELRLLQQCTYVFVNSQTLYDKFHYLRQDVRLVPLGFDRVRFRTRSPKSSVRLPHNQPIIGYIGGINSRLDYPLLLDVVQKNARVNFVFVGPIQKHESNDVFDDRVKPDIDALYGFPNVHHLPYVPKDMIPGIIRQFDIGMIPYDTSKQFNKFCYPMKIFEYFYIGKPVVATQITELKRFPEYVKIGATASQWGKHIAELLSKPWAASRKAAQLRLALANSWEKKFAAIQPIIDQDTTL